MFRSLRAPAGAAAIFASLAAVALLAIWPHVGEARRPTAPARTSEYTFVADPAVVVTRLRHDLHWPGFEVGYLDAAGNFWTMDVDAHRLMSGRRPGGCS